MIYMTAILDWNVLNDMDTTWNNFKVHLVADLCTKYGLKVVLRPMRWGITEPLSVELDEPFGSILYLDDNIFIYDWWYDTFRHTPPKRVSKKVDLRRTGA